MENFAQMVDKKFDEKEGDRYITGVGDGKPYGMERQWLPSKGSIFTAATRVCM